jgi:hypothetical protein
LSTAVVALAIVAGIVGVALAAGILRRLSAAVWTIRARAWLPSLSRALSGWVNAADYFGEAFFTADGADAAIMRHRSAALNRLAESLKAGRAKSADWRASVREGFSDIRFADANRVPFRLRARCASVSTSPRW